MHEMKGSLLRRHRVPRSSYTTDRIEGDHGYSPLIVTSVLSVRRWAAHTATALLHAIPMCDHAGRLSRCFAPAAQKRSAQTFEASRSVQRRGYALMKLN